MAVGVVIETEWQPFPGIIAADVMRFGLDIRSFREPLTNAIREVMVPSIRTNFEVGGRPGWPALAPLTLQIKLNKGFTGGILVRKGVLRRVASQINIWKIGQDEAQIESLPERAWYGVAHQTGYVGGFGHQTPAREWAVIQPQDADDIEEVFWRWLAMRAARRGFLL